MDCSLTKKCTPITATVIQFVCTHLRSRKPHLSEKNNPLLKCHYRKKARISCKRQTLDCVEMLRSSGTER